MVRKLSSGQTVAAIKQLRKIATLKKAVSTRQKLLLTMLGLAGGTAGLSASNKDSIGDYWGNKMQGEMSDDDAMKRDYGITDEELASGMDTSDFDAMPDYGSKEDISNNLNAEAAQIGDSKYDNNADAELQKLLGSGVADSLKGSPLWGGDDGEAAKNYDYSNDDMAGLFDLEGATPDNEMSDEDIMKRDYGITDEELSSGMGTSDLDAIPDYKKDEDLQSIIAGGAGGDPQVSEEEDIRALLDQNDDLELGSSQSVPMDLSRPADIPQNLERPPADVPVYSDDMQGLFDMVDNPPEQPGGQPGGQPTEDDIRAFLDQNDDLELGSSQSVPMDMSRPEAPTFNPYSSDMQGIFNLLPKTMQSKLKPKQDQTDLSDYDPLLDELLPR